MLPMADPFITTQDLVDYLGRGGTADAGMIQAADAACDIVRTLSEQTINQVMGGTATLDGTGTDALLLPELPVTAAGTVNVNGTAVTDYVLSDNGTLFRGTAGTAGAGWTCGTWPWGRQNVVVTYDHGWADADIPRDLRMVALSIASRLVVQGPALQESIGQTTIRYGVNSTDLTNGEKAILRKYRRTK